MLRRAVSFPIHGSVREVDGGGEVRVTPLWLYPNFLSLDAPLVAVAWMHIFAERFLVRLHWKSYLSLALVVWVIYVGDRIMDASVQKSGSIRIQPRHEFHRKHRFAFVAIAGIAIVVAGSIKLPALTLLHYFHLLFLGVAILGFLALSAWSSGTTMGVSYTKNIVAGMAFAYGTAFTVYADKDLGVVAFLASPEFMCFGALCSSNISAIDLWEHAAHEGPTSPNLTGMFAMTIPLCLLSAAALVCLLTVPEVGARSFYFSILTGAILLQALNLTSWRRSVEELRVLADVALLIPYIVFLITRNG